VQQPNPVPMTTTPSARELIVVVYPTRESERGVLQSAVRSCSPLRLRFPLGPPFHVGVVALEARAVDRE